MSAVFKGIVAATVLVGSSLAVTAPAEARYHHRGNGDAALVAGIVGLGVGAAIASSDRDDRGYYGYDSGPSYYAPVDYAPAYYGGYGGGYSYGYTPIYYGGYGYDYGRRYHGGYYGRGHRDWGRGGYDRGHRDGGYRDHDRGDRGYGRGDRGDRGHRR